MSDTTEKVVCYDRPNDNSALWAAVMGNKDNGADLATLMNNQNGMWNNPFVYLVWMMFAQRMWNNGNDGTAQNAETMGQLSAIRETLNNNQNSNLVMDAIKGNASAISALASNLNTDYNTMAQSVCGVKSAIEQVGGQVGYSSERVINAVNLGDAGITSALQTCCCENKTLTQQLGYESQLATERQTGILGSKIDAFSAQSQLQSANNTAALNSRVDQLANGVQQGFAQIGYQMATDKCDIINAGNANTQAIKDLLTTHWQAETSQALQDAKFEISQLKQNQTLLAALNNGCGCNN